MKEESDLSHDGTACRLLWEFFRVVVFWGVCAPNANLQSWTDLLMK